MDLINKLFIVNKLVTLMIEFKIVKALFISSSVSYLFSVLILFYFFDRPINNNSVEGSYCYSIPSFNFVVVVSLLHRGGNTL